MVTDFLHSFWQRAPRRLRATRAGRILIVISLAAGLAALNTGNNLLFFTWGMVLSAIVVSGVLSEATLRYLRCTECLQAPWRAGQPGLVVAQLRNSSAHLPAFGLQATAHIKGPKNSTSKMAPYALRLGPTQQLRLQVPYTPEVRGAYDVAAWEITTAYPFGFFEKSRRLPGGQGRFYSAPRPVVVESLVRKLVGHFGALAAGTPGAGEDYFALRPHRQGDDWRRINWRRSARSGRLVSVEYEATAGLEVLLALHLDPRAAPDAQEAALSVLGSLAEALLQLGLGVGVHTAQVAMLPDRGTGHVARILAALARLDVRAPMPRTALRQTHCMPVTLVGPGALPPAAAAAGVTLDMGSVAI